MALQELTPLVEDGFSCWLLVEELPDTFDREPFDFLAERAAIIGEELRRKLDDAGRRELVAALTAATMDPQHPLVRAAIKGSNFYWTTEEAWPALQRTWQLLIQELEPGREDLPAA